jgi:FAD dependent oxidoreductase
MAALPGKPANLPSPSPTNSFWLRSPSPFLLHHRSTPELPLAADVVIVGSGITGAFCARYLAESAELKVVMVEAREACWGATGRVR